MVAQRNEKANITAIDVDKQAVKQAKNNVILSPWSNRIEVVQADATIFESPVLYDTILSNPPYFVGGAVSKSAPVARHERLCSLDSLFASAAWALQYGGDFFLVHKPERLAELCSCATAHKLEPKRLMLLRHQPSDPVNLIFLQCRKGGKPGLVWEEECLQDANGNHSDYYRRLYHI